jgi:hypothetical protein
LDLGGYVEKVVVAMFGQEWTKRKKSSTAHEMVAYITGVSWGAGDKIKKVTWSVDPAKAISMLPVTAAKIAKVYSNLHVQIVPYGHMIVPCPARHIRVGWLAAVPGPVETVPIPNFKG